MTFSSPEFFILLPALALAGWFWRGLKLHQPLRILILLLAVTALAGPEIRRQQNTLDLHVLLDRSESTEDLIDKGLPEWQDLLETSRPSRRDQLRFFNYGAEIAELGADGSAFTGSRALTRTNLALSAIAAEADVRRPSRILLFTDGFSTEPLAESLAQLRARNIPLDFRLVRGETAGDFRLTRITLPERAGLGEPFPISILIRGAADATFPLIIRRDGQVISDAPVTVKDGTATVEFTDRLPRSGSYHYEAEIRPPEDARTGNNKAGRWIGIAGGPRVLLITRYQEDPLAAALRSMDLAVEIVTDGSKLHPGMLDGARAVVLNNVPAHEIPADFLKSLDFYVREQAGSFLMAGGKHAFGSGGYFQSPVDELLPVSMELKSEHRKLAVALAIVMDRSGSMAVEIGGGKTKMDLANSGAANAIDLLGPADQAAVIAVDSEPSIVVPLTKVSEKKQGMIARTLKVKSSGGGIFIYPALKAAWEELRKSPAGTRHVILFSDAADSEEPGDYRNLIAEMTKAGCTISVIGLGTKADADSALLEDIAKLGKGRVFFSDRPMDIPKIFAQETVTIARSAFIDAPVKTRATGRWHEIAAKPLAWLPEIDGYNLSYPRPDATVSLIAQDEYAGPLVAHARRGLGRTAAISFPLGGEFSQRVRGWESYGDFLQTLARFLTDNETPPGIALRHKLEGTRLTIDLLYDPAAWSEKFNSAPPLLKLRDDVTGVAADLPWRRLAPGHFSATRELEPGAVIRGAVQAAGHALPFGPVSPGSSVEWDFEPETIAALRSASSATGGRELADLSKAWLRPPYIAHAALAPWLLIALVPLILAEALLTRTGWKFPVITKSLRTTAGKKSRTPKNFRPSAPRKPLPANSAPAEINTPPPIPVSPPSADLAPSERSSRFQRAKDRK